MGGSQAPSKGARATGVLLLGVGVALFLVRLQHEGGYAIPRGGNLRAGLLALGLGGFLVRDWFGVHRLAAPLRWAALAASPVVLFFALYSTLAEFEEVVVLKATHRSGQAADLRLWIVDRDDGAWVTMKGSKAEAHVLDGARLELQRGGELRCVLASRHDERATVDAVHRARAEKYAVQRLATVAGVFDRDAKPDIVALRLTPCPEGGD